MYDNMNEWNYLGQHKVDFENTDVTICCGYGYDDIQTVCPSLRFMEICISVTEWEIRRQTVL